MLWFNDLPIEEIAEKFKAGATLDGLSYDYDLSVKNLERRLRKFLGKEVYDEILDRPEPPVEYEPNTGDCHHCAYKMPGNIQCPKCGKWGWEGGQ
jgi:hypothetical protein